jgi:hypothetical protein
MGIVWEASSAIPIYSREDPEFRSSTCVHPVSRRFRIFSGILIPIVGIPSSRKKHFPHVLQCEIGELSEIARITSNADHSIEIFLLPFNKRTGVENPQRNPVDMAFLVYTRVGLNQTRVENIRYAVIPTVMSTPVE